MPCPAHHFANHGREEDRATFLGAIDDVDSAKIRSTVGLMVGANWVMDVVDAIGGCWDGDPDRCTYPTTYDLRPPRDSLALGFSYHCHRPFPLKLRLAAKSRKAMYSLDLRRVTHLGVSPAI